jgi:hypothetical protein
MAEENVPAREISRFRFSSVTLRRAGRRSYLTEPFLGDLAEELAQLGWILMRISADQYAMLRADKAASWIQIATKRLNLDWQDLPSGPIGNGFRSYLEDIDHPEATILQMTDDDIIEVFDAAGDQPEDEGEEE